MADDTPINKNDLDLTEAELNKIFFGSDKKKTDLPADSKPIQSKSLPNKPVKLDNQNTQDLVKRIEKSIDTNQPIEPAESEETKRPHGRPKKWTEEKIIQLKEERKRLAKQKRDERWENIRTGKLGTNEPKSKYEADKILDKIIKTQQEIEDTVSNKREELKTILKKDSINFYSRRDVCTDHIFKFAFYDPSGVMAVCKACSTEQHFELNEWKMYITRNRGKL